MNAPQHIGQLIHAVQKIRAGTFDVHEVRAVYGLLREDIRARVGRKGQSTTLEIADCLAHPVREKGATLQRAVAFITEIEKEIQKVRADLTVKAHPMASVVADLNSEIHRAGLPPIQGRDHALSLVILTALQGTRLKTDKYDVTLYLVVTPPRTKIELAGFVTVGPFNNAFPLFSMPNVYNLPPIMPHPTIPGDWPLITAAFDEGKPHIAQQASRPLVVDFTRKK